MINAQDKRWVYKMHFPVPRLTTSPATMIISICSSEMKRPPTQKLWLSKDLQNCLKNCDFRKIFKIGSKTVTIEHSKMDLSDDERLQQVFCFVSWKQFMLGTFYPVKILCMIEANMTYACLLWSYYFGFCHRCLKCHFIDNCFNVSEVSCLRNIRWYNRILFPRTRAFFAFQVTA